MLDLKLLLDKGKTIVQIIQLALCRKVDKDTISTGIKEFDKAMEGGFRAGDLVTISGETGQGKTTFAQTLTYNLSKKQNLPTLWFSYEMMDYYLAEKFKKMGVTYKDPIYAPVELSSGALDFIEKEIIEAKQDEWVGCKAVFIDHLHYLIPLEASGQNSSLAIGGIVRGLKLIAVKHKIIIFLIVHTKKIYQDEELGLSSVRDSSFIVQESDYTFLVKREKAPKPKIRKDQRDEYTRPDYGSDWLPTTIIQLAKNRQLGEMVFLRFILKNKTLIPITQDYEEESEETLVDN